MSINDTTDEKSTASRLRAHDDLVELGTATDGSIWFYNQDAHEVIHVETALGECVRFVERVVLAPIVFSGGPNTGREES